MAVKKKEVCPGGVQEKRSPGLAGERFRVWRLCNRREFHDFFIRFDQSQAAVGQKSGIGQIETELLAQVFNIPGNLWLSEQYD
jgi:hypothetical protein